jgi:DNA-binding NarL/FixJ family response regulator
MTDPIRLLLADDQQMVRAGFRLVLDAQPDMSVVGEANDGAEALQLVDELAPDVVLMDIRMPVLDGLGATEKIMTSHPEAKILVLTTFDLDEYVHSALRAGASGFMLKDAGPTELLAAIRAVRDGDSVVAPSATRRLIERFIPSGRRGCDHNRPEARRDSLRPGARGAYLRRRRTHERRDRRTALPGRDDRQNPHWPHPVKAGAARPRLHGHHGL